MPARRWLRRLGVLRAARRGAATSVRGGTMDDASLLYHGDPLVQFEPHMDGAFCMLCKKYSANIAAHQSHIDSVQHRAKLTAGLAEGTVTRLPGLFARLWTKVDETVYGLQLKIELLLLSWLLCTQWLVDLTLMVFADRWPRSCPPPPRNVNETRPGTEWCAWSRGCEIRVCDEPGKGRGVFAIRHIRPGTVVGVYLGEQLSQRAYARRHRDDRTQEQGAAAAGDAEHYAEERAARISRLDALPASVAPMGGSSNRGKYIWDLLPKSVRYDNSRVAYVDAEDPFRSSWCRYINHAPTSTQGCNLTTRVDALRGLIWFESRREIDIGDELQCDYLGDSTRRGQRIRNWLESRYTDALQGGKRYAAADAESEEMIMVRDGDGEFSIDG